MSSQNVESEMEEGRASDQSCQQKRSFALVFPEFLKYKQWAARRWGFFTSQSTGNCSAGGSDSTKLQSPKANNRTNNPDRQVIIRKLEDSPEGYPRLAAFLDSYDSFMIYRRFGFLHARVLLHKQDELRELEDQLDAKDKEDAGQPILKSRVRDDKTAPAEGRGSTRKQILAEIEKKLNEYDKLLIKARDLVSFNRPVGRDYRSVEHYIDNTKPLVRREAQFIRKKEDFVTLKPSRDNAWLDNALEERLLKRMHYRLVGWIFCSEETKAKTDDDRVIYYTKNRVERFVAMLLNIAIMALLVLPIYALSRLCLNAPPGKVPVLAIGVLLVFMLVFSAVLSAFTRAKRHEILGASAAYGAVLVVFIGNIKNGK